MSLSEMSRISKIMSFCGGLFKEKNLTSSQVNEHNQVTDRKVLGKVRYKFGFANVLYHGEEAGLALVYTVIIRALGGGAVHLGVSGSTSGITSIAQLFGALLLKKFNSDRTAMNATLLGGVVCASLICVVLMLALIPSLGLYTLWAFLILSLILAALSGILWNIETNWIGDLVPREILGWFSGPKWVVAVIGVFCFMLLFGKASDIYPNMLTYAGMFFIVTVSHVIAILLMRTIPNRVPKNANFISAGESHHERLNYKSLPFWCYITFYLLWSGGRTALIAFTTAYLLDQFHYSMIKIVFITGIQNAVSVLMLLFMGKVTDKHGNRIPLILVSVTVACCMFLWVVSAWWGIIPIIVYQFINGMAGYTHSMLGINYGLEIFPDKGRAGYFGCSRIFIGVAMMSFSVVAGYFLRYIDGWHWQLLGATLNHYHFFFMLCTLITLCCVIPLIIVGKRTVQEG